jgi:hypothetical protein
MMVTALASDVIFINQVQASQSKIAVSPCKSLFVLSRTCLYQVHMLSETKTPKIVDEIKDRDIWKLLLNQKSDLSI